MSVVDYEPTLAVRSGKLCQGVHGGIVLGEQRDLVERDHRVPHALRLPLAAGYRCNRGEGEQADRIAPVEDGVGSESVRPATSSMKRPIVELASTVTG